MAPIGTRDPHGDEPLETLSPRQSATAGELFPLVILYPFVVLASRSLARQHLLALGTMVACRREDFSCLVSPFVFGWNALRSDTGDHVLGSAEPFHS